MKTLRLITISLFLVLGITNCQKVDGLILKQTDHPIPKEQLTFKPKVSIVDLKGWWKLLAVSTKDSSKAIVDSWYYFNEDQLNMKIIDRSGTHIDGCTILSYLNTNKFNIYSWQNSEIGVKPFARDEYKFNESTQEVTIIRNTGGCIKGLGFFSPLFTVKQSTTDEYLNLTYLTSTDQGYLQLKLARRPNNP